MTRYFNSGYTAVHGVLNPYVIGYYSFDDTQWCDEIGGTFGDGAIYSLRFNGPKGFTSYIPYNHEGGTHHSSKYAGCYLHSLKGATKDWVIYLIGRIRCPDH